MARLLRSRHVEALQSPLGVLLLSLLGGGIAFVVMSSIMPDQAAAAGIYFALFVVTAHLVRSVHQLNVRGARAGETAKHPHAQDMMMSLVRSNPQSMISTEGRRDRSARDPLTGLLDRSAFKSKVEAHLSGRTEGQRNWLMFVDLDGFKQVNDQNGHDCGDTVLKICAHRLKTAAQIPSLASNDQEDAPREPVILSRFGGDEFVLFIAVEMDRNDVERMVQRMLKVVSEEIVVGQRSVAVGASIGIASSPEHGTSFGELMRAADAAMYAAKSDSSNRIVFYDQQLNVKAKKLAKLEEELHTAISKGELDFVFQPVFDLRTSRLVSAEALVRWHHPDGEVLRPAQFFEALHRARLAAPFSEWAIARIISIIAELNRRNRPIMIAANIAPQQLASLQFISLIKTHLARSDCPPKLLQIEVTEDAAMRDPAVTVQSLHKLHALGITLAIDDFGVGYSNLARLTELPLSRLKIDRSLVEALDTKPSAFVLMQSIINLSNSLGIHSVVEGIETAEQLSMVSSMGADLGQGFLLSKPVTMERLVSLIEAQSLITTPAGSKQGQLAEDRGEVLRQTPLAEASISRG